MSKAQLRDENQESNVTLERQVLRNAGPHPFVVECHSGFQTDEAVVLVLEYLSGGDFYDLLKTNGALTEEQARFYLAEVAVAIGELHRHNFVLRDVKLENMLLDEHGHVRLTDFGLAARVKGIGDTSVMDLSGTAIYQAPEILNKDGHGFAVDWWALGVLTYVMLVGKPPFFSDNRTELYRQIRDAKLDLKTNPTTANFDDTTVDFVESLLCKDPTTRLGSKAGVDEVVKHPFFAGIDFESLLKMELIPPLPPAKKPPPQEDVDNPNSPDTLQAHREFLEKLSVKQGGPRGKSGFSEYVPIRLANSRTSIGLDFGFRRKAAVRRTWTGTTDDLGRNVHT
eukprot:Plantae.Rhodophyta-Rhodochaete_pulchella.ctg4932.p1 GENE.Plantae.Rhodophyta-Rhodochaete_pulchella.ctg4932~~Plantae.Rhodophyta-Rhodochaete_pulchella.ctg4932.p1  ORF type:complete len:339 (+),score=65.95 Plantae.Rhodophyta-Rhodochaete_pulchella.ctg4932:76-1092(+)